MIRPIPCSRCRILPDEWKDMSLMYCPECGFALKGCPADDFPMRMLVRYWNDCNAGWNPERADHRPGGYRSLKDADGESRNILLIQPEDLSDDPGEWMHRTWLCREDRAAINLVGFMHGPFMPARLPAAGEADSGHAVIVEIPVNS